MLGGVEARADDGVKVDTVNLAVLQPVFAEPEWSAAGPEHSAAREEVVRTAAQANVQLLANDLFALPRERVGDIAVTALTGTPMLSLPRRLPLPVQRMQTRWEVFAKEKGIKKHKRERMVWDEEHKEHRPIFGYKRANDTSKPAIIEVKDSDPNPFADPFDAKDEERAQARAKQRTREARNIAEREKGRRMSPAELRKERRLLDKSTASLGKFLEKPEKQPAGKPKKKKKAVDTKTKKRKASGGAGASVAKRRRKGK